MYLQLLLMTGAKDSRLTLTFDDTGMVRTGKNVTVDEKTVNGRTTYTINAADAAANMIS